MEKNIRVAVRVRPFCQRELEQNQRTIITTVDTKTLIFDPEEDLDEFFYQGSKVNHRDITKKINKKLSMDYDDVFGAESTNHDVFGTCMKPLVSSVMDGFNCSVFVYGATGAGKTFTMLGGHDEKGIIFLTMKELFDQIESLMENRKFDIGISYLEVYNEQVKNLLTKSGPLLLREDSHGVIVVGLILKKIDCVEELFELLTLGNRNRTQHPTDANAESSRSHAVFQVHIRMTDKKSLQKRTVKLSMIDLAGSERAASTKCNGMRFKEGASINKSLLALGNCINSLADGLKHIPYRDSNLTRILKDSLGGNCQTLMIANVSPSSLTYEDTYNTLKYASRAKNIRTTLKQNILKSNMSKDYYIKTANTQREENVKLMALVKQLEAKLAAKPAETTKTLISSASFDLSEIDDWYVKIDAVYTPAINAMHSLLTLQSKDKILKLRALFKKETEANVKILELNGVNLNANIAKLEASIDKFGKESSRQQKDLGIWLSRYHQAVKSINNLRKGVTETKYSKILLNYIKSKDSEMEFEKLSISEKHLTQAYCIYKSEFSSYKNALGKSLDINQECYLLLRATGNLDSNMLDKIDIVQKLIQGQRVVQFGDNNSQCDLNILDLNSLETQPSFEEEISQSGTKKRTKPASFDNDEHFAIPDVKKNKTKLFNDFKCEDFLPTIATSSSSSTIGYRLNEPLVLRSDDCVLEGIKELTDDNMNDTFKVVPTAKVVGRPILCERNPNNHVTELVAKKGIKTTTLSRVNSIRSRPMGVVSKENKKFSPGRARRSPRVLKTISKINKTGITNRALQMLTHHRTKSSSSSSSEKSDSVKRIPPQPIVKQKL